MYKHKWNKNRLGWSINQSSASDICKHHPVWSEFMAANQTRSAGDHWEKQRDLHTHSEHVCGTESRCTHVQAQYIRLHHNNTLSIKHTKHQTALSPKCDWTRETGDEKQKSEEKKQPDSHRQRRNTHAQALEHVYHLFPFHHAVWRPSHLLPSSQWWRRSPQIRTHTDHYSQHIDSLL